MNSYGDKDALLFSVLRHVIWRRELVIPSEQWQDVMTLAQEQAVFGLAFESVIENEKPPISRELLLQWLAIAEQVKVQNNKVNKDLEVFARWMTEHEIDYRVVKGQIVAQCYSKPHLRQSGDIDFWVNPKDIKCCEELIEKDLMVTLQRNESEKHVEYQWQGLQYELHSHLATFAVKKHQRYFETLEQEDKGMAVRIGETDVATLSPTFNAIYIFVHLFHHLIHMGVGLRQLCDWMMWLHQYQEVIDREALREHLNQLGLYRPYCVLGVILVDDLGLPVEEFPFEITVKDRQRSRKALQDIMELGNFGHNKEKVRKLGLLHSLHTGWRMCVQSMKYIDLAPQEIVCRIPHTVMWYLRK